MTELKEICAFVQSKLLTGNDAAEDNYITTFLSSLMNSVDINSNRLLACIGIDIKAYEKICVTNKECEELCLLFREIILRIEKVKSALFSVPPDLLTPAIYFNISLNDIPIKPLIRASINEKYIRVISFRNYIEWTVRLNFDSNPDFPEDMDYHEIDRHYSEFINEGLFENIKIANLSSGTGWVFVASYEEVIETLDKKDTIGLLDMLGLYAENINIVDNYIWLKYPENFSDLLFQPSTLTGDWGNYFNARISVGNEFFLSYKKQDDWGRTFSVSGNRKSIKERVHYKLESRVAYNFLANDLGRLEEPISKASNNIILEEAISRFINA